MGESLEEFIETPEEKDEAKRKKLLAMAPTPEKVMVLWKLRDGSDFSAFMTFWPGERDDMTRGKYRLRNLEKKVENFLRQATMDLKYYPANKDSIEIVAWKKWESGDW